MTKSKYIGKRVFVPWGQFTNGCPAEIVEDRGHIGAGGRHLVRVRLEMEGLVEEPLEFELPLEHVIFEE
jgi:hypothetical protein